MGPRTVRFIVGRLPLLLLYPVKLVCTNVSKLPLARLVLTLALVLSLVLLCHFVCLGQVACDIKGRRFIFRCNMFRHGISCLRLCHVISFGRRRAFVRRLYKLGAIDVCSKSEAAPHLSVVNIGGKYRCISLVHRQMRCGGEEGNVCRVAGH